MGHCGRPYGHYHAFRKANHPQYPNQCPYKGCQTYGIDHTKSFPLLAISIDVPSSVNIIMDRPEKDIAQMDTAGGVSMPGTTTVSGSGTGGAAQPFAEDANATLTQTADNPPAIIGGTGAAAPEVMESLGGFTIELLPRGAFTNSILAPCYAPCPLA